jgi:hypothetical protein
MRTGESSTEGGEPLLENGFPGLFAFGVSPWEIACGVLPHLVSGETAPTEGLRSHGDCVHRRCAEGIPEGRTRRGD